MPRHPLIELTLTRLREFVREPEALFWAFVFPVVMSVAMAVAFPNRGTTPVVVGVSGAGDTASARHALTAVPGITVKDIAREDEEQAIREGQVDLILVPANPPVYRFDPARAESRTARAIVDDALKRAAGRRDPWTAKDEPMEVPGSRYVDWLLPGIIGMNIMSTGMWGISFSIVQARMRKLLKRLIASPMRRRDYLLAQVLGRLVLLGPEVAVPLAVGALALGVPIRGSLPAIGVVVLAGALAFGGLGLLAASRARTFEAVSGILNMSMLPMWVLSGVFFSASRFPAPLQPLIQALPLTALNDALRAVILEGATVGAVRGELALLLVWAIAPFGLALAIFRWR